MDNFENENMNGINNEEMADQEVTASESREYSPELSAAEMEQNTEYVMAGNQGRESSEAEEMPQASAPEERPYSYEHYSASELAAAAKKKRIEEKRARQEKRRALRNEKKQKSGGSGAGRIFGKIGVGAACGLAFGLCAALVVVGVFKLAQMSGFEFFPQTQKAEAVAESAPAILEQAPVINESGSTQVGGYTVIDASDVAEKCMPSIVAITNSYTETYESFWGMPNRVQAEASGSGIIVGQNDTELLIVTNSHVIEDADALSVQFCDESVVNAAIKGSKSQEDLAIIAVKLSDMSDTTMQAISIATLGDSDSLKVGEPAIAIGNSLGYGQSVTSGIISALNRDFDADGDGKDVRSVIQTDAAINPGNSGGALLNMKGEVIGINEAKYSSTSVEGVGYAIPISTAKPIIEDLVTKTTRAELKDGQNGFLGVGGVDVTEETAAVYGMPKGVYVAQISEGSAAERAGIVKGDIITSFDGESISTMEELRKTISYYPAGTTVELTLERTGSDGYEEITLSVTLDQKPEQQ